MIELLLSGGVNAEENERFDLNNILSTFCEIQTLFS